MNETFIKVALVFAVASICTVFYDTKVHTLHVNELKESRVECHPVDRGVAVSVGGDLEKEQGVWSCRLWIICVSM